MYVVVWFGLCRDGFVVSRARVRVDGVYSFLVIEVRRRAEAVRSAANIHLLGI